MNSISDINEAIEYIEDNVIPTDIKDTVLDALDFYKEMITLG